ncbi:MAG TPA: SIMPL domain-containing protein [Longimicrobiales bacterium]|nr:SIMPL domain-containing protein [Longimicrobiales bacterium]
MKRLIVATLLLAAPLAAQDSSAVRTITVSATGHVERAPDRVVLAFAAETTGRTAAEASQANARVMDRVLRALTGVGVPKERIHTQRLGLQPQYAQQKPGDRSEPEIIGYRAQNQVQVVLEAVDHAGAVVDAAVGAGANRVSGIWFELADRESARLEALRQAVSQARAEADAMAQALGETLGPVLSASTDASPEHPLLRAATTMAMSAAGRPPTDVEPGTIDVSATVHLVFLLGGG